MSLKNYIEIEMFICLMFESRHQYIGMSLALLELSKDVIEGYESYQ